MGNELHGDQPLQQDVDPFLGPEPILPQGPEAIEGLTPEELNDPTKREEVGDAETAEEPPADTAAEEVEEPPADTAAEEVPEGEELEGEEPAATAAGKSAPSWKAYRGAKKAAKEAETQMRELEKERAADRARLEMMERQLHQYYQQQQQAAAAAQNPQQDANRPLTTEELIELREQDPLGYARLVAESAALRTQQIEQMALQSQEEYRQQRQFDEFRRSHNDYDDAIKFLREKEVALATAAGATEAQIEAHLNARAEQLMRAAQSAGRSLPEAAYAVAQAYGWAPTPLSPPPAAAPRPAKATPQETVRAAKARAILENTSLAAVSGDTGSKAVYTAADVAAMSEAEMERLEREDPNWADKVVP